MPDDKTALVPVNQGDVFACFITESNALIQEVRARRIFTEEVTAFLKAKGLLQEFETFRDERKNASVPAETLPIEME